MGRAEKVELETFRGQSRQACRLTSPSSSPADLSLWVFVTQSLSMQLVTLQLQPGPFPAPPSSPKPARPLPLVQLLFPARKPVPGPRAGGKAAEAMHLLVARGTGQLSDTGATCQPLVHTDQA